MFGETSRLFFITYHEKLCLLYKDARGGNSDIVILTPTKQLHPVLFIKEGYNINQ